MEISTSLKPALLGALAGAAGLVALPVTWGGWVTNDSAQRGASNTASSAVVAALAPICLVQFQQKPDSSLQIAALKEISSYDQTSFVEKAGWATMPGSTAPVSGVAKACAALISNLK